MDFENEIEPLVVRNNNQISDITSSLTPETRVSEVINLSSSEDDEQRTLPNSEGSVKYATNNNVKKSHYFVGYVSAQLSSQRKYENKTRGLIS